MGKDELKTMYGEDKANAYIKFHEKLKAIKTKHSDYLKENELDFESLYTFQITDYDVLFKIVNQDVLNIPLKTDLDLAFSESFSKLFKKG
tara:strand:- start:1726 stop:1995 length:270 start_codon:yes stop_codon:yes gene_type:complete